MFKKVNLPGIMYWIFLSLVAIWPALYNQFPLVTSDSGAYIYSGIRMTLGLDRPWTYGIYLLLTTWSISLWGAIWGQGLLFAWLVSEVCKKTLRNRTNPFVVAAVTLLIVFGTSAAWFNSQLMADAFTGLLLLAILVLLSGGNSKRKTILVSAFIFFALTMHSAHMIVTLLVSTVLFVYARKMQLQLYTRIAARLFLLSVSAILVTCVMYAGGGYGFRLSPVSHVFLMSRMAENGILDEYLAEHCPVEKLSLCASQGNTGDRQWAFMWNGGYPHSRDNGWIDTRKDYNKIIYGSLASPKYLGLHIVKNTEAGLRELSQLYVGDGIDHGFPPGSSPYNNIDAYFHHQIKEFRSSVQNTAALPLYPSNLIIVGFAALAGILAFYMRNRQIKTVAATVYGTVNWNVIFGVTLTFIVINAFVSATFSTVIARLQSRVFWVLPLICVLYIYDQFHKNNEGRLQ